MKTLTTCILGMLLHMCMLQSNAQAVPLNEPDYNKPLLFSDLPEVLELKVAYLETLFDQPVGSSTNQAIATGLLLKGTIVSKTNSSDKDVSSIVLRSSNRAGAVFTFSKVFEEDGTFRYIGRLFSLENSDAYEVALVDNRWVLQKKHLYDIINE